jgi:hypothetical protein
LDFGVKNVENQNLLKFNRIPLAENRHEGEKAINGDPGQKATVTIQAGGGSEAVMEFWIHFQH